MISIDDKAILSLGGFVIMMPAKPIVTLAAIGAISVLAVGYYMITDDNEE